jgi:predicted transposase YdaD
MEGEVVKEYCRNCRCASCRDVRGKPAKEAARMRSLGSQEDRRMHKLSRVRPMFDARQAGASIASIAQEHLLSVERVRQLIRWFERNETQS